MKCVELSTTGNFDPWETSKLQELRQKRIGQSLGQELLFENKNIRVWEVILFPKERLPFRKVNNNYNLVSMTDGLAVTRCGSGKISLLRIKQGDSVFINAEGTESVCDLENIGENILFLHIMEFKPLILKAYNSNISSFS